MIGNIVEIKTVSMSAQKLEKLKVTMMMMGMHLMIW